MGKFSTFLVAILAVVLFAAGIVTGKTFFEKFRDRPPYRPAVLDRTDPDAADLHTYTTSRFG